MPPKITLAKTSANIKTLEQLLEVEPLEAKDANGKYKKWPEVDQIILDAGYDLTGGTGLLHLKNYLIAAIKDTPKTPNNKPIRKLINLTGRVWTHLVINDNTASNGKKPIRDAVKNHFFDGNFKQGEDLLRANDVKFDDRERTIRTNKMGQQRADQRAESSITISLERVKLICEKMKSDYESNPKKYKLNIVLLVELCFGSRWVEALFFSTYSAGKLEPIGKKKIKSKYVTQTNTAKRFRQGDDERLIDIKKPSLPYIDADWLIDKLTEFRESDEAIEARIGSYDSNNTNDKRLANKYRTRANTRLQRYFPDLFTRAEMKANNDENLQRAVSSHLLRAIYINVAYELFNVKETKPIFVQKLLGHLNKEVGARYGDVLIVPAEEDQNEIDMLDEQANAEQADAEEDPDEEKAEEAADENDEEPIREAIEPPEIEEREDNLEPPEDVIQENKTLKKRITSLERELATVKRNQTIFIDMMKSIQNGLAQLTQ